jgi:hypothetical protein
VGSFTGLVAGAGAAGFVLTCAAAGVLAARARQAARRQRLKAVMAKDFPEYRRES